MAVWTQKLRARKARRRCSMMLSCGSGAIVRSDLKLRLQLVHVLERSIPPPYRQLRASKRVCLSAIPSTLSVWPQPCIAGRRYCTRRDQSRSAKRLCSSQVFKRKGCSGGLNWLGAIRSSHVASVCSWRIGRRGFVWCVCGGSDVWPIHLIMSPGSDVCLSFEIRGIHGKSFEVEDPT